MKRRKTIATGEVKKTTVRKTIVVLILIVLVASSYFGWGLYRSYNDIILNKFSYTSEKISEPIRIVMMSDLHDHQFGEDNQEVVDIVRSVDPDLVLLNGDLINDDTQNIDSVIHLVHTLETTAPVYLSVGNQELENPHWSQFSDQLKSEGVRVLDAEYVDLNVDNQPVRLGGLYDYSFALNSNNTVDETKMNPETVSFLNDFQKTDSLKIMMTHRPDTFLFNQSPGYWDVDLALAGHTHGGQVILPFLGGLWAPDLGWFPDYVYGVKRFGGLTLITSSGLSSGYEKLPRWNNPPEVMQIDILPSE